MINCLVVLNTQHVIKNKIEIKYMVKEQLPGCIKHTASHSPKIQVK